jgi:hypothetical protein
MAKSANRRSRSFARRSVRKAWWRSEGSFSPLVSTSSHSKRADAEESQPTEEGWLIAPDPGIACSKKPRLSRGLFIARPSYTDGGSGRLLSLKIN